MNRTKSIFMVFYFAMTALLILGFIDKAYAPPLGGCCANATNYQSRVPPPPIVPQPGPSIFIKYKWSPEDILNAFNERGLGVEKTGPVTRSDYKKLPAKAKEAIKFSVSSIGKEGIGCILSFEMGSSMEKIMNHYLKKNKNEELYSWTFAKDNVLVVLNGRIPEEKARMFESVLNQLDKK